MIFLQMMDESARLLAAQQQIEKDSDGKITVFGLSINETIRECLLNGMSRWADRVKSDFKVADKRYSNMASQLHAEMAIDILHLTDSGIQSCTR